MTILVVEDDDDKRLEIVRFVSLLEPTPIVIQARSMQSGRKAILQSNANVIVLDMTMPTFDITVEEDGGRPQAFAGRELLRHMRRKGLDTPVIILTQYEKFGDGADALTLEELDRELRHEHSARYLGIVSYNAATEEWKERLRTLLLGIE